MTLRTVALIFSLALDLLVAPLAAGAQQPGKVARVGVLAGYPRETSRTTMPPFFAQLREMGYVEGQDFVIEYRHSADKERYGRLAAELVALKIDVIFAADPYALRASRQATRRSPSLGTIWRATLSPRASRPASRGRAATSPGSFWTSPR